MRLNNTLGISCINNNCFENSNLSMLKTLIVDGNFRYYIGKLYVLTDVTVYDRVIRETVSN